MIRPSPLTLVLLAAGLPLALLPVFLGPEWTRIFVGYVSAIGIAVLIDALRLPTRGRMTLAEVEDHDRPIGTEGELSLTLPHLEDPRTVRWRVEFGDGVWGPPEIRHWHTPVADTAVYPYRTHRRGESAIEAIYSISAAPWGLVESVHRHPVDAVVRVIPNVRAVRAAALEFFQSRAQPGQKVDRLIGTGSEFDSLEEYLPGRDPRNIDWKATARHQQLVVRTYRAERNHAVILAIDTGWRMREPRDGMPALDHAIGAALTLAYVALRTGDRVGIYSFGARPGAFIPPVSGVKSIPTLQRALAELDYSTEETNFTLGLTHLSTVVRRRALVVMFTDFSDSITAELLVENTQRLSQRHFVLFVSLRDPDLDRRIDAAIDSIEALGESVVAAEQRQEREVVIRRLEQRGVRCVDRVPRGLSVQLLNQYLDIRRRESVG